MGDELKQAEAGHADLRESFSSKITLNASFRRQQLTNLKNLLEENERQLCEALWEDLRKNSADANFTEIRMVLHEIQYHLDHLEENMTPKKVSTDDLNQPGYSEIRYNPLGVVLVIGAWNYPVQLSLLPCVGAIAAGNCVVLKMPSDKYTSEVSRVMCELVPHYMDDRTFRVLAGDRKMTQAVLKPRWDHIFFTGGSYVGKMVAEAAAKTLTPITLELGGKSPVIIDDTADITVAARRVCWGRNINAGQTCIAPDYLMIHEDKVDEFISLYEENVEKFYTEDPQRSEFFGRAVNDRAWKGLHGILEKDRDFVRVGGESDQKDLYIAPTLLDFEDDWDAFSNSAAMANEIFGPILPVVTFTRRKQCLDFIAAREKPLAFYVFTENKEFKEKVAHETSSGGLCFNDVLVHISNDLLPFGGIGNSGMGQYHGKFSFECFSHRKGILYKTKYLDLDLRYPPYNDTKEKILGVIHRVQKKEDNDKIKKIGAGIAGYYLFRKRRRIGNALRAIVDFACGPAARL